MLDEDKEVVDCGQLRTAVAAAQHELDARNGEGIVQVSEQEPRAVTGKELLELGVIKEEEVKLEVELRS